MNTKNYKSPDETWVFKDWCQSVGFVIEGRGGLKHYDRFMDTLNLVPKIEGVNIGRDKFLSWFSNDGVIHDRDDAKQAITVLHHFARINDRTILNGVYFIDHARLFLKSRAVCGQPLGELEGWEIEQITVGDISDLPDPPPLPSDKGWFDLMRRVFPRPSTYAYGRDEDIKKIVDQLSNSSPILVLTGNAGDGKTNLAWHTARYAVETEGKYDMVDWMTDRRVFVNVDGSLKHTRIPPLDMRGLLNSLATRFRWNDVKLAPERDIMGLCSDKLRQGHYLIVVDNIESQEQAEPILDGLYQLLGSKPLRTSRAIVTSRVQLPLEGVQRYDVTGIPTEACVAFIKDLEEHRHKRPMLSDRQRRILAETAGGNPLFLQIALARLSAVNGMFDDLIDAIRTGTTLYAAFQNMFGMLYDTLSVVARDVAILASQPTAEITYAHLVDEVQVHLQLDRESFEIAIEELIQHRVLHEGVVEGEYTMHPLVRAYLLRKFEEG